MFRTISDLVRSLDRAGLSVQTATIAATARPSVFFLRRQVPDDGLPAGTSKIGGIPDLPADFAWPERPPYPDAEARAAKTRETGSRLVELQRRMRDSADLPREVRLGITNEILLDIARRYEDLAVLQHESLPHAFVGQVDLGGLSGAPGLDPLLPDRGLLSFFADLGEGEVRVAWHDVPKDALRRRPLPAALVAYHERFDERRHGGSSDWAALKQAETLHPVSGIAVPDHWRAFFGDTGDAARLRSWFETAAYQLELKAPADFGSASGNFGDHLGGWPAVIQDNVEDDLARAAGQTPITVPGRTPWRHLFSFGAEYYGGTRLVATEVAGDGNTYVMMREEDLRARRFERAASVYQQT